MDNRLEELQPLVVTLLNKIRDSANNYLTREEYIDLELLLNNIKKSLFAFFKGEKS